jgi:hydroxymethylpyrimidine pyrophosphatase-like HAD family hydrolase
MPRRYDILAVDIDGTLIDHNNRVHPRSVEAIARARQEGLKVVLCTGRALIECKSVIALINQTDPVIVSGGAVISEPVTGRTIERFTMPLGLVRRIADHLLSRRHPSLLLKDPDAAGFDYLVISPWGPEALDPASRWWFDHMGVRCRFAEKLEDDEHPEHTVRVGAYSANNPVAALATELQEMFHAEVMLQHFTGVLLPKERRDQGIESIHIVEVFNPLADKWQALSRLAATMGIPRERIAAIGDQTNDQTMIGNAGLGIAMANAHPSVAAVAGRTSLSAEDGGVGFAIDEILAGRW